MPGLEIRRARQWLNYAPPLPSEKREIYTKTLCKFCLSVSILVGDVVTFVLLFENLGENQSKLLAELVGKDQHLRSKFSDVINSKGWSPELVKTFIQTHGTSEDDVFGSKKVEEEFARIFSSLDFERFDPEDWENFDLLIMHQRDPKHANLRRKALAKMVKAGVNWKPLATDIARELKLLPELEGKTLSYPKDCEQNGEVSNLLKKKGLNWFKLAKTLIKGE